MMAASGGGEDGNDRDEFHDESEDDENITPYKMAHPPPNSTQEQIKRHFYKQCYGSGGEGQNEMGKDMGPNCSAMKIAPVKSW